MADDNNQNPAAKIFEICHLILDIICVHIKLIFTFVLSLIHCIVPPEEKSVAGEKVLITGTGHGIGKELARQYGELGAEVICVDINPKTNQETVDELKKRGIRAHAFECDVSKRENVLELARKIKSEVGDVTILVNNAGIMPCKKLKDYTPNDITRIFDINVFAHFWLLEVFLPSMMEKNSGHVVALSSVAGLMGLPNLVPYCASKFAVRGLMEAACEELRQKPESFQIGFTTVYPYMTATGLCKSPRIRFPSILSEQSPETVAANIISAQRRGWREITVPNWMGIMHNVGRTLPLKGQELLIDFMDSGVNPTD